MYRVILQINVILTVALVERQVALVERQVALVEQQVAAEN
jgi:hypothetical protein